MTEEKKELNFYDIKNKEEFITADYTEEENEGKLYAKATSPKGIKAQRIIKDESRENNKKLIKRLSWVTYLLPSLAGLGLVLTDNLLWLWISILLTFVVFESTYYANILKVKYQKTVFFWKKEKFIAFSVALGLISGYLLSGYIIKRIIKSIGFPAILEWLAKYGLILALIILAVMAIIGWLVLNRNLPIDKLGKERVQ